MRHIKESLSNQFIAKGLLTVADFFMTPLFLNSEDGALTSLYVATSPKLNNVSGEYFIPTASKGTSTPHLLPFLSDSLHVILTDNLIRIRQIY